MKLWRECVVVGILLLVVALNIAPFFALDKLPFLDPTTGQVPRLLALKESVTKYGNWFPEWNPYLNAGEPINDGIFQGIDSLTGLLIFTLPFYTGLNLAYAIPVLLSALFMYLLARYLFKNALIAALVAFIFSSAGYEIIMLVTASMHQLIGFAIMPLIFLFAIKATKESKWLLNAALAGIMLAVQIRLAPDMKVTLFTGLALAALLLVNLFGTDLKKTLLKTAAIGIIILVIGGGLAADKIISLKQTIDATNRAHLSYAESTQRTTSLNEFFEVAIQPLTLNPTGRHGWFAMGIIATALAGIGIWFNRTNKIIIFICLTLLISALIATASPLFYLLWKYVPPWSSFRYVERAFSIWSLGIALAAGYGIKTLIERFKGKEMIALAIIAALLFLNIIVLTKGPAPIYYCNVEQLLEDNPVWNSINNTGYFRVTQFETRGIDWPSDPYTTYAGLEGLYGYTSTWVPQYMNEYLVAAQNNPAKMWGIMNVKYVSSMQPLNVSGLTLIKQFSPVTYNGDCPPKEESRAYGPYLYENEQFIPRAIIVNHSISVFGNAQDSRSVAYQIMLSESFDPKKSVVLMRDEPGQLGVLEWNDNTPNIEIPDSNIVRKSFEEVRITLPAHGSGTLVLSERFFYFKGWKAYADGKPTQIKRANGFVSAISLSSTEKEVTLRYEPNHVTK